MDRGSAKILLQNSSVGIFGCLQQGYQRLLRRIAEPPEPIQCVLGELHGGHNGLSDQAGILSIEDALIALLGFGVSAIAMKAVWPILPKAT